MKIKEVSKKLSLPISTLHYDKKERTMVLASHLYEKVRE